jgi:hypothetical protein
MFSDVNHPNVTLSEWEAFKVSETARQSLITEIVDREDCGFFPDWFTPLARGVAIAAPVLLAEVGYRKGMRSPPDWIKRNPDVYSLPLGHTKGAKRSDALIARRCDKHNLWMIERRVADVEQVLVCIFGSTPILAPDCKSAMCLAKHCNVDNPPHGLRWINFAPADCENAIKFAKERHAHETFGTGEALSDDRLH